MSVPTITLQERVWTNDETQGSFETFVYQPSNADERALGTLFIVGNLEEDHADEEDLFLLNAIASLARRSFFTPPAGAESLDALEFALRQVNTYLSKQAENGKVAWFGALHCVIGCVRDDNVHVSYTGHPALWLLREGGIQDITQHLAPAEHGAQDAVVKVFSAIASGALQEDDCFLITAPSVSDWKPLFLALRNSATDDIFAELHAPQDPPSYAALLFDAREHGGNEVFVYHDFAAEPEKAVPQSRQSLQSTVDTSPPVESRPSSIVWRIGKRAGAIVLAALRMVGQHGRTLLVLLARGVRVLGSLLGRALHRLPLERYTQRLRRRFPVLRLRRPRMRYPFHLAIVGASVGMGMLAVVLLLPSGAPVPVASSGLAISGETTLPITTLVPHHVADVSDNPFSFTPADLVVLGEERLLYSSTSGSLYRLLDGRSPQFVLFAANDGFRDAIVHDEAAVFLSNDHRLFRYGAVQGATGVVPLTPSYGLERVRDMASFNNALYFLRDDGAIYKYTLNDEQAYEETVWAERTLSDAAALAIDGSIYVVSNNGNVAEYSRGQLVRAVSLKESASPLGLFTSSEHSSLIVSLRDRGGVVVIDKETGTQERLQFGRVTTIDRVTTDTVLRTLYLLSGTDVYSASIPPR